MAKRVKKVKTSKKFTIVREHLLTVPVSEKNPTGQTLRDTHPRRIKGTYLDTSETKSIFKNYDRSEIIYPTSKKLLKEYRDSDNYDDLIAVWSDYFKKKFKSENPIDPDVVKALIASESSFKADPKRNRIIARGLTQITKSTHKILQDPQGESREFIFKNILQRDLADPNISIPMAIRWLYRKQQTAASKLKRVPTHEDIILEYKGLLKSNSAYKQKGLSKYRQAYDKLKK